MERTMKIVSIGQDTARNYTDRSGQPAVMHTRLVVLTDGLDTIAAELTGKPAETIDPTYYPAGSLVRVTIRFRVQQGREREMLFNSITLEHLVKYA